jgi:DNA-directed RNA polymerase subunit RPC12/RpoP
MSSLTWWDRLAPSFTADTSHRDCRLGGVPVHRIVLSLASPLLQELLAAGEGEAEVLLPGVEEGAVHQLLDWLYAGGGPGPGAGAEALACHLGIQVPAAPPGEEADPGTTVLYVEQQEAVEVLEAVEVSVQAEVELVYTPALEEPGEAVGAVKPRGRVRPPAGPSPKMRCPSCGKVLSSRHYEKHHRAACTGELVLSCGLCGRAGFCTAATLQDHVRARHTMERPYTCRLCGRAFPAASHLAHHRAKKHSVNSRGELQPRATFPCPECGKVLTTRPKLQAHVRVVHQGIKDYACAHCSKSFSSKSNLDIHVGSAHTGVLPYKCDLCEKSFTRKNLLAQHTKAGHQFSEAQTSPPVPSRNV